MHGSETGIGIGKAREGNKDVSVVVNITAVLMLVAAWAFVCARIFVRIRDRTKGIDDVLMVIGLAGFTVFCALTIKSNAVGSLMKNKAKNSTSKDQTHAHERMAEAMFRDRLYFLIAQLSYAVASIPIRASLCASLLRIAKERRHKIILWAVIVTCIASASIPTAGILTQAQPIQALWDMKLYLKHEVTSRDMGYLGSFLFTYSALSVAQDFVIAAMPAVILWNLQTKRPERIRLMLLLGMGASAAIATLIRVYFLTGQQYVKYGNVPVFICTIFELGVAIIAGSLAPLRKSFARWWGQCTRREWWKLRTQPLSLSQPAIELPERNAGILQLVNRSDDGRGRFI